MSAHDAEALGGLRRRRRLESEFAEQSHGALDQLNVGRELAAVQVLLFEGEAEIVNEACKPFVIRKLES